MSWFMRFTRFGDIHAVYGQEQPNSCGIACVLMATFKINKLVPGRTALHAETQVYDVYGRVSASTYDGSAYTYTNHLASTLNQLNVGTWRSEQIGMSAIPEAITNSVGTDIVGLGPVVNGIRRGSPIIVLVGWREGDAHFVLIDTVNSILGATYASVCDPWDADIHITRFRRGEDFKYAGGAVRGSWSIGSTPRAYTTPREGNANGWIVRRV